jgi:hypothetical protein
VSGTVHSHPSGALHPSDADIRLFRSWGRRHLILGAPYGRGSWRAYDGNGRETTLHVVETPSNAFDPPVARYRGPPTLPPVPEEAIEGEFPEDQA